MEDEAGEERKEKTGNMVVRIVDWSGRVGEVIGFLKFQSADSFLKKIISTIPNSSARILYKSSFSPSPPRKHLLLTCSYLFNSPQCASNSAILSFKVENLLCIPVT